MRAFRLLGALAAVCFASGTSYGILPGQAEFAVPAPRSDRQDGSKIKIEAPLGQTAVVKRTAEFQAEIKSVSAESKVHSVSVSVEEEFEQSGASNELTVACTRSVVKRDGVATRSAHEGKKFKLVRNGQGIKILGEDNKPAEGAERVGDWLDLEKLLPAQEVAVGDSWKVKANGLAAGVPVAEIEYTCKLEKAEGEEAHIVVTGAATGDQAALKYDVKLAGLLVVDTGKKRVKSFEITGTLWSSEKHFKVEKDLNTGIERKREVGTIEMISKKLTAKVSFSYE